MITSDQWETLIAAIVAMLGVIKAIIEANKNSQITAFFTDPNTVTQGATSASTVDALPAKSWRMPDDVKAVALAGLSVQDASAVNMQIASAEAQHLTDYQVTYSTGWYHISWGQIVGSGSGGK